MHLPECFRIPADELTARSPVPLTITPDLPSLHEHFARSVFDAIAEAGAQNRSLRLILPVGPVGYLPLLAEKCNRAQLGWAHVHAFFMDEYCDWQGRAVPPEHPLSFYGYANRMLFDRLEPPLRIPPEQLHFPDPLHIDRIGEAIAAVGGVDVCYGGIGVHGHIAFNEPPISRWFRLTPAEFKASKTRLVSLAPETVVMNATRAASGNFALLPPMAVTLGMADILAARRIRLYAQGGVWQRAVLRVALFGSPYATDASGEDVDYPVTLLRSHPDLAIVADVETAQPAIPAMAA